MNAVPEGAAPASPAWAPPAAKRPLSPRQLRQIAFLTAGGLALFVLVRYLPTGTNLTHMDFRVEGGNVIQMCDPLHPQFIPVVDVRSPVAMLVATTTPAVVGHEVQATFTLHTASGKPIGPDDLLVAHTKKLHLMICDPSLEDYRHVHPQPTTVPGEWSFRFTPHRSGVYRLFADFTPVATGLGLYANTDLTIAGPPDPPVTGRTLSWSREQDGYRFVLEPRVLPIRVRQVVDLTFLVTRDGGGAVPLEPVMDAYAHLVAFDEARSGFAHLHPMEANLQEHPDANHPRLTFKISIPRAGRYVIWAQVNLAGRETFVPFWFDVLP